MQGRGGHVLAEAGAVVTIDQQCHPAAAVDMARPSEGLVERGKFLEQKLVPLQRRNRFRAARADIDAIAHDVSSISKTRRSPRRFGPELPSSRGKSQMSRWCGAGPALTAGS